MSSMNVNVITEQKAKLLDELQHLLERQIELVRKGGCYLGRVVSD